MGIPILIIGESGSGKSTSLRNFGENEAGVLNVAGKPLPFRKKLPIFDNVGYLEIQKVLKKNSKKVYVIDDSQYLMAFSMFARAKEKNYGKYTDIAVDFTNLVNTVIRETSKDTIVYFLHHIESDDKGFLKAKTVGKVLDNQITLEGLFSIVLLSQIHNNRYVFLTQSQGFCTAKSPIDMFDRIIDNDLKFVDTTIREYWNLSTNNQENENDKTFNELIATIN